MIIMAENGQLEILNGKYFREKSVVLFCEINKTFIGTLKELIINPFWCIQHDIDLFASAYITFLQPIDK